MASNEEAADDPINRIRVEERHDDRTWQDQGANEHQNQAYGGGDLKWTPTKASNMPKGRGGG